MRKFQLASLLAAACAVVLPEVAHAQQPAPGPVQTIPPPQPTAPDMVPVDLTRTEASGLTAEQVGQRAAATSFQAKAQEENLRGAAARVDQAWASFLPRLSALGRYTRLSDFTPPVLFGAPPGNSVYTNFNSGDPNAPTPIPAGTPTVAFPSPSFAIPLVLNNWLLQGTITVPISDYFLRINQGYTAATQQHDAIRLDAIAAPRPVWGHFECHSAWLEIILCGHLIKP